MSQYSVAESIFESLKTMSRIKLQDFRNRETVDLLGDCEFDQSEGCFADNTCMILLSEKSGVIALKVHFSEVVANEWSRKLLGKERDQEIDSNQLRDFFREYCNQLAAYVRSAIEDKDVLFGMSLPIWVNGKHESAFRDLNYQQRTRKAWRLGQNDSSIVVSAEVCALDLRICSEVAGALEQKAQLDLNSTGQDSEVEFF